MKDIQKELERWESEVLKKHTQKVSERKKSFRTFSDIEMKGLYSPLDTKEIVPEDIGFPGEYPFTRGVQPTMYRGRLWTMRQYAGFGTARESNQRYKYLLDHGQTGLSVAFDLPTQMGRDSDHPVCCGEVGKVGVAIDSLEDMESLFADIPLDKVSVSMTINSTASSLLAMFIAMAEKQNVPATAIRGTIQNDVLKEYVARGTYIYPPRESMRVITDIFAFCKESVPKWNTISISGYHIREAGSNAIQEVAFTLCNAIAYVQAAIDSGLQVDEFAPRLSFFFNVQSDFLEEVAKFRAARRLWAKIMKERFQAKNPRSWALRFHTQTAGASLTAQQPDNNIVRVTLQAMAAVLGGTQSLHTNSRDEALAIPSEESVQIALRTQQIIAEETGVANTADPLGGSYIIEHMTSKIEGEVQKYIDKIDSIGGAVKAIEEGFIQREIQESAYCFQKDIEAEERVVVGVNKYSTDDSPSIPLLKINPKTEEEQCERLKALRARRDDASVKACLQKLKDTAQQDTNLMPPILEAVKAYATLGEISDVLREVFGEYREKSFL